MSKPGLVGVLALLLPVALLACSSDDGPGKYSTIPAAFSKYCTGTLKGEHELLEAKGSGWEGGMGSPDAAAGSIFALGDQYGGWAGYVFQSDGEPFLIDTESGKGLTEGTDFTTDCALDGVLTKETVLMTEATLYANEQLTGVACKIPAATPLTNMWFSYDFVVAKVSANEVKQLCGWDEAYSKSFVYAELLVK